MKKLNAVLLVAMLAFSLPVSAQSPVKPVSSQSSIPRPEYLTVLVQSTIQYLNQANQANDYSLLLRLASTQMQSSTNPASLSASFQPFRQANIDLAPSVIYGIRWNAAPAINNGILSLNGNITSQPNEVKFDFRYVLENGKWRLAGLSVGLVPGQATTN